MYAMYIFDTCICATWSLNWNKGAIDAPNDIWTMTDVVKILLADLTASLFASTGW
jgi:hypothetical protein